LAVALETGGAASAAEWINNADPRYPCLIDDRHHVADLYGMVNVANAVWINEYGQIVRPVEPAGVSDAIRSMDRTTGQLPQDIHDLIERRRSFYYDAIRDWVTKGDKSVYALSQEEALNRMEHRSYDDALAAANFQMGVHLHQRSFIEDAKRYFNETIRLKPLGWNYRRQIWNLAASGDARKLYWEALDALGDTPYIASIQMDNMP